MTLPDFTPFNIFILLLAGLASFVSSNAKKTGRILAPIFWTGIAAGVVTGLSMSLFMDSDSPGRTAIMMGFIFGVLGGTGGHLIDLLVQDGKKSA